MPDLQTISKSMAGIVKALDSAMASNNLERVAQTMDQFEHQFENLDIQSEFVSNAMNNQASLSTPEDEVNGLMQQVTIIFMGLTLCALLLLSLCSLDFAIRHSCDGQPMCAGAASPCEKFASLALLADFSLSCLLQLPGKCLALTC